MTKTRLNPSALYWASFNTFELRLPGQCVTDCSHSGTCDADVAYWAPKIREQIEKDGFKNAPTPEKIRKELSEHGADWDEEKDSDETWFERLVWIAANDISESDEPDCTEPVKG